MPDRQLLRTIDAALAAADLSRAAALLRAALRARPNNLLLLERMTRIASAQNDQHTVDSVHKRVRRLLAARPACTDTGCPRPLRVLFVQPTPCIRNYKMAQALSGRGHIVVLAYTEKRLSEAYAGLSDDVYADCVRLGDHKDLWRLSSMFDIIHSHNEPDFLSVAALAADAPLIHDTHDLISLRDTQDASVAFFEGVANRGAAGRIYTTPYQQREARELYDVSGPSLVFYNYASSADLPKKCHPKLSAHDGALHFVYEGGISTSRHRDFRDIFVKIASRGAHVHIYPASFNQELEAFFAQFPRIHYYQPVSPKQIMEEMTRYDIGMIPWNLEKGNRRFLDSTVANKLFEYLASGLPVAASSIRSYTDYFAQNPVGVVFDTVEDLFENGLPQLQRIIQETDFARQTFTFEGEIENVERFYRQILEAPPRRTGETAS